ncbi:MAG: ArsR family transcriptional regulator [Candidatus Nanoarchaeia archaeon]|nr:ArsR family transcriptional regulator [Candidatus Nanoarchaeia archaeon]
MKTPQEIEARYVIPLIRKELVLALAKNNLNQKEIAGILGLTNAAVSQYLKKKRANTKINLNRETKDMIKESAKKIAEKKSCSVKEIHCICKAMRKDKTLCRLHKSIEKVPCSCKICGCGE